MRQIMLLGTYHKQNPGEFFSFMQIVVDIWLGPYEELPSSVTKRENST